VGRPAGFPALTNNNLSETRKRELTALAANVDVRTVGKMVESWNTVRELKNWDDGVRGGAAPSHPSAIARTTADALETFIDDFCTTYNATSLNPLTRRAIIQAVYREKDEHLSNRQLQRILGNLDINYGRVLHIPNEDKRAEHDWLRIFFIAKYAKILKLAAEGKAYIVNVDESSIGTLHSPKYGFRRDDAPFAFHVSKSKGETVCFVHAIAKTGLVGQYGTDGKIVVPPFEPPEGSAPVASAEHIFVGKKRRRGADYHVHYNQAWFQDYLRNNLIPALRAQFPDAFPGPKGEPATKKIYILLDNAPYHYALLKKGQGSIDDKSRVEIVNLLRAHGIKSVLFPELNKDGFVENKEFDVMNDAILKQSSALPIEALVWCAKTALADKTPELFHNAAERIAAAAGVELVWVPPCSPWFSPIEEVFARVKRFAAFTWTGKSQPADTASRLHDAMYTNKTATENARVTAGNFVLPHAPKPGKSVATVKGGCPSAEALWRHQVENMNDWIAHRCPTVASGGKWLSGSITDLQVHAEVRENLWRCQTRETMLAWVRKMIANRVGYVRATRAEDAAAEEKGDDSESDDEEDDSSDE
jgi:hypothetical protein